MSLLTAPAGTDSDLVRLVVERALGRSRLTSFFRLLLVIPHAIVLVGLGIAALVVTVIAWFAALVLGRVPTGLREFLCCFVSWYARYTAYLFLLTDRYPPFRFAAPDYPIQVVLPPAGPLRRWAVLARIVLVIPAYVVSALLGGIQLFVGFAWFAAVFTGRTPRAVFDAIATTVRYQVRLVAYLWLLTPTYPWGPLGDRVERPAILPYGYPPAPYPPQPGYPPQPDYQPYPPMPPAVEPAAQHGDRSEAGWYDGVVTGGGRAILIVSLVLGGVWLAANAATTAAGGLSVGFGQIGQTYDLTRDRVSFDRAIDDASCPVPGTACDQQVATRLLTASARLSRDTHSAGSAAPQRDRLRADLQDFHGAVRDAAGNGSLVDATGGVADYQVLTAQTRVDQDVSDLLRAIA